MQRHRKFLWDAIRKELAKLDSQIVQDGILDFKIFKT